MKKDMFTVEKIDIALEQIRPFLNDDGGDIRVVEVSDEGDVLLEFVGACSTCSMSEMTFKTGVEEVLKKAIPEIRSIKALNLSSIDK